MTFTVTTPITTGFLPATSNPDPAAAMRISLAARHAATQTGCSVIDVFVEWGLLTVDDVTEQELYAIRDCARALRASYGA